MPKEIQLRFGLAEDVTPEIFMAKVANALATMGVLRVGEFVGYKERELIYRQDIDVGEPWFVAVPQFEMRTTLRRK